MLDNYTKEKEVQYWIDKYSRLEEDKQSANKFYMIALNLSGQRENLEEEATSLITKYGLLKALKISRGE